MKYTHGHMTRQGRNEDKTQDETHTLIFPSWKLSLFVSFQGWNHPETGVGKNNKSPSLYFLP